MKKIKKCNNRHGYHAPKQISEHLFSEGDKVQRYSCTECSSEWDIYYTPKGNPVNEELFAQVFAKDYLQPHHADFELVYGKREIDFSNESTLKAEKETKRKKEELAEYKKHINKGKVLL